MQAKAFSAETFAFVQPLLERAVADGVATHAAAAIGYRDAAPFITVAGAANLATRFDLASMSKIFGPTMLTLKALEGGDLTLDDTLHDFFPQTPADKGDITLRQLLTHTGGFTPTFPIYEAISDPADVLECILRQPLVAPPDGTARYSCIGFILLGKILEQVYGAPLNELAAARVFVPLGLCHTGYVPQGENFAPTEVDAQTGLAWQGVVHDENARFLRGVSGNAGVFADIADCARFAAMLASAGGGYVAPSTLRRATANYTPGQAAHRGLGFHLAGVPGSFFGDLFPDDGFGHTGFTGTSLVVDPGSGLYAVLLTNRVYPTRANEKLFRFRRVFHNRVWAAFDRLCLTFYR